MYTRIPLTGQRYRYIIHIYNYLRTDYITGLSVWGASSKLSLLPQLVLRERLGFFRHD
jgi:hypothetical protein